MTLFEGKQVIFVGASLREYDALIVGIPDAEHGEVHLSVLHEGMQKPSSATHVRYSEVPVAGTWHYQESTVPVEGK